MGEVETGRTLGSTGPLLNELQVGYRPCLKRQRSSVQGMTPEIVFWPAYVCLHICTYIHKELHTHTYTSRNLKHVQYREVVGPTTIPNSSRIHFLKHFSECPWEEARNKNDITKKRFYSVFNQTISLLRKNTKSKAPSSKC